MSMVKSELIENLAERADITLAKAEEIVDLFFDAVTETLCNGHRVRLGVSRRFHRPGQGL